jgi:HPt (histidine-containing phosphotransfer) domain-containing protein
VEIFKEQVVFFLRDAPGLLAGIQEALVAGDTDRLRTTAHRLKGLAAGFDAQAVTERAFDLEQRGRRGDLQETAPILKQLEEALSQLTAALIGYLECSPSASTNGS